MTLKTNSDQSLSIACLPIDMFKEIGAFLPLSEFGGVIKVRRVFLEIFITQLNSHVAKARVIEDDHDRSGTLAKIVSELKTGKCFKEAMEIAASIPVDSTRKTALAEGCLPLHKGNNLQRLTEEIRLVSSKRFRWRAFQDVTKMLTQGSRFNKAIEVAHFILNDSLKWACFGEIAVSLARNDCAMALTTARMIPADVRAKANLLGQISTSLMEWVAALTRAKEALRYEEGGHLVSELYRQGVPCGPDCVQMLNRYAAMEVDRCIAREDIGGALRFVSLMPDPWRGRLLGVIFDSFEVESQIDKEIQCILATRKKEDWPTAVVDYATSLGVWGRRTQLTFLNQERVCRISERAKAAFLLAFNAVQLPPGERDSLFNEERLEAAYKARRCHF